MDLSGAFNALLLWIWSAIVSVFSALWLMFKDAVFWVFDQLLGIAVSAVGIIDVTGVVDQLGWFSAIPDGVAVVMAASGLSSALGIVMAALAIRFVLQLIPFVRLGS